MSKLVEQWRGFSAAERSQYALEVWGAVSLSAFMLLIAVGFAGAPNAQIFARIGGRGGALVLGLVALAGALAAPGLIPLRRRLPVYWKRRAYAVLSVALVFYAVTVFWFAHDTGTFGASVVGYMLYYNLISLAGVAVYRGG